MIDSQRHFRTLSVLFLLASFAIFSCAGRDSATPGVGEAPDFGDEEPEIATDPAFSELKGGFLEGIPEFPAYPDATLIGSAERNRPDERNRGYRIKWTTKDSPEEVMKWFEKALIEAGWKYKPSSEPDDEEDLIADIEKAEFQGFIEAESEEESTEITVVLTRR